MSQYKLSVEIGVQEVDDRGCYLGQGLQVREHLDLVNVRGFLSIAQVLGRFHELGEQLRREQTGPGAQGCPPYPACEHRPNAMLAHANLDPCPGCLP